MVSGLMVFGPDWPGQGMFGSVQFGQVWFGLVGSELVRFGATRPDPAQPSPARWSSVQAAFGRPAGMRTGDLGVLGMVSVPRAWAEGREPKVFRSLAEAVQSPGRSRAEAVQ